MSTAALNLNAASRPAVNPWFVATAVVIPTFMEILDTTIATASMRYIAGGLSATMNDSDWVMTSYLAANAPAFLIDPTSGLEKSSAVRGRLADLRGGRSGFGESTAAAQPMSHLRNLGIAPNFTDTQPWFNTPGGRPRRSTGCAGTWSSSTSGPTRASTACGPCPSCVPSTPATATTG